MTARFDATGVTATHTYTDARRVHARLRVTDPQGKSRLTSRTITVGNRRPTVTLDRRRTAAFFDWGERDPVHGHHVTTPRTAPPRSARASPGPSASATTSTPTR